MRVGGGLPVGHLFNTMCPTLPPMVDLFAASKTAWGNCVVCDDPAASTTTVAEEEVGVGTRNIF